MIYYSIPWSSNKNIAEYYNSFMELLPSDDDFACFIDGDAMFTISTFGKQLEDIIAKYPECGFFTCKTNRVMNPYQIAYEYGYGADDIYEHRLFGTLKHSNDYDKITNITNTQPMSGVLILLKKSTWKKIGGFRGEGMLGVDNNLHVDAIKAGERLYRMDGVYVYHWHRGGNKRDTSHLK